MKDTPATNRLGLPDRQREGRRHQQGHGHLHRAAVPEHLQHRGPDLHREEVGLQRRARRVEVRDKNPIGTGPYTLAKFSPQGLTFKANPNYWGGKPPVPEVDVPSYSTNDVALQQLSAGKIDYAGNFVSQIQTSFVAKDPAHNKYWFPAINVVNLVFNVSHRPGRR